MAAGLVKRLLKRSEQTKTIRLPAAVEADQVVGERRGINPWLDAHPFVCGYAAMAVCVAVILATNLTTFAISLLFLYLVSDFLTNDLRRLAPFLPKALLFSILYVAVIALMFLVAYNIIPNVVRQVPGLARDLQEQALVLFAKADARWGLTQYVNIEDVRGHIVSASTSAIGVAVGNLTDAYHGFFFFVFALFVNLLFYHNLDKVDAVFARRPASLMGFLYRFVVARTRLFYHYFKKVMGGQIMISAVNTAISTIVIYGLGMPKPALLVLTVFLCGLFPIVGNLVSNSILTATALVAIGPWAAAVCLGLLIGIHKLEYFLNSKIIGDIVHLPMVVTITALIVFDALIGIPGLILAIPILLFGRDELERIPGILGTVTGFSQEEIGDSH